MWTLIWSHLLIVLLLTAFFSALGYSLWLRQKMKASKASFALSIVGAMSSAFLAFLRFGSGPEPASLTNSLLSSIRGLTGWNSIPASANDSGWFVALAAGLVTIVLLVCMFKLGKTTILSWEGPVTVSVNELAKRQQDNDIAMLAFAEFRRLLARKPDPIASDVAVNWQQKISDPPNTPPWHQFARRLFETTFTEALIPDNGWRDRWQVWVGKIYVSQSALAETCPLVVFVFDTEPSDGILEERITAYVNDGASIEGSKVFAVFHSETSFESRTVNLPNCTAEIFPHRFLLKKGLKLIDYARDLIKRFDLDVLGGTQSTLKDTFVECHVQKPGSEDRQALSKILSEWIVEKGRRHLAITGEYGQGKSTAMLDFCVKWANRYLANGAVGESIPLLIELRGQNPAESDPLTFFSGWASRYGLPPKQLFNLIQAGEAILIFEGFDELRHAGRAYDRHEHFNALWRMAYPGTKVIFTGRPNFFLDEAEKNRTLRADALRGAAGNAFTDLWELDGLTKDEVEKVACGFGADLGLSIMQAAAAHPAFFDIVCRPSMLPVVATIWDKIEELQQKGQGLTSAILLEHYIRAIYLRKEEDILRDQQKSLVPESANYLLLPREILELFTLAVVWRMAGLEARNTIDRATFDDVIHKTCDEIFRIGKAQGVPAEIPRRIRAFEERFRDDTRADQLERICNEVASAGLFVSDPAGGPSNLRLPHKQYYEFIIAKIAWLILYKREYYVSKLFSRSELSEGVFENVLSEFGSIQFLSEMIGIDFSGFDSLVLKLDLIFFIALWQVQTFFENMYVIIGNVLRDRRLSKKSINGNHARTEKPESPLVYSAFRSFIENDIQRRRGILMSCIMFSMSSLFMLSNYPPPCHGRRSLNPWRDGPQ